MMVCNNHISVGGRNENRQRYLRRRQMFHRCALEVGDEISSDSDICSPFTGVSQDGEERQQRWVQREKGKKEMKKRDERYNIRKRGDYEIEYCEEPRKINFYYTSSDNVSSFPVCQEFYCTHQGVSFSFTTPGVENKG